MISMPEQGTRESDSLMESHDPSYLGCKLVKKVEPPLIIVASDLHGAGGVAV
jgi:hypothetical protein